MRMLTGLIGARRAIEVGVFTGYSALSVALALPEDGELIACDVNEEWTDIARRYWSEAGVASKIRLHLAPALETLDALIREGRSGSSTPRSSMPTRRATTCTTNGASICCVRRACSGRQRAVEREGRRRE